MTTWEIKYGNVVLAPGMTLVCQFGGELFEVLDIDAKAQEVRTVREDGVKYTVEADWLDDFKLRAR